MIFLKNPILHNSSFMRVWPKTIIIAKFALKFWLDSTSQISKMIFLDPFREDFHFLHKIHEFLMVSGPSKLTFHQPLASKLHLREFAPTKTCPLQYANQKNIISRTTSSRTSIFPIFLIFDFINLYSTLPTDGLYEHSNGNPKTWVHVLIEMSAIQERDGPVNEFLKHLYGCQVDWIEIARDGDNWNKFKEDFANAPRGRK